MRALGNQYWQDALAGISRIAPGKGCRPAAQVTLPGVLTRPSQQQQQALSNCCSSGPLTPTCTRIRLSGNVAVLEKPRVIVMMVGTIIVLSLVQDSADSSPVAPHNPPRLCAGSH